MRDEEDDDGADILPGGQEPRPPPSIRERDTTHNPLGTHHKSCAEPCRYDDIADLAFTLPLATVIQTMSKEKQAVCCGRSITVNVFEEPITLSDDLIRRPCATNCLLNPTAYLPGDPLVMENHSFGSSQGLTVC